MIGFRGGADIATALDAAAAADPDNPSRSELIRRIVTGWLETRGHMPSATISLLDHEDAERRQQANVNAGQRSARERKVRKS